MGWLNGWAYRYAVIIDNSLNSEDLVDYQVGICLDNSIDFDRVKPDGSDIRITAEDGLTLLPHYVEFIDVENKKGFIWVKVSIPAYSKKLIYLYHGNSLAEDISDAKAVFDFFDDFSVWEGWVTYGNGVISQDTTTFGFPVLKKDLYTDPNGGYKSLGFTLDYPFVFECRVYRPNVSTTGNYNDLGVIDDSGNGYSVAASMYNNIIQATRRDNYIGTSISYLFSTTINSLFDTWHKIRLIWNNGTINAYCLRDDNSVVESVSATDTTYSSFTRVHVFGGYPYYVDWIRIRKYTDKEPTVSIFKDSIGWLTGWSYRRLIDIDNTQSLDNLYDYQILVELNDTNFDFDLAKPDGSDIRFSDEDGSSILPYFIEEYDSVNRVAKIWVKIPFIPAQSIKNIYIYYGNEYAQSISDPNLVFDFFDDFDGTALSSGWSVGGTAPTAYSLSNSVLTFPALANGNVFIYRSFPVSGDCVIDIKLRHQSSTYRTGALIFSKTDPPSLEAYCSVMHYSDTEYGVYSYNFGGITADLFVASCPDNTVFHILSVAKNSGQTLKIYFNNVLLTDSVVNPGSYLCILPDTPSDYLIIGNLDNNASIDVDWVRIRKYAVIEPTVNVRYRRGLSWLVGWKYRKQLIMDFSSISNSLYNSVFCITLDDTNFDFDLAKPDGSDIRLCYSDGLSILPYFIEKYDNLNKIAKIWVKVPFVPSNSQGVIFLYYGNPDIDTDSNGSKVFEFFDDFENTFDWSVLGSPLVTLDNSIFYHGDYSLKIQGFYSELNYDTVYKDFGFSLMPPFTVEYWCRTEVLPEAQALMLVDENGNGYAFSTIFSILSFHHAIFTANNYDLGIPLDDVPFSGSFYGLWRFYRIVHDGTTLSFEMYDEAGNLLASVSTTDSTYRKFTRIAFATSGTANIDFIKVYKYNPDIAFYPVSFFDREQDVAPYSFSYIKVINISPTTFEGDFQVLITVDTATLISEGKMRPDCSDIRIYHPAKEKFLPYWIEPDTMNTASTKIWFRIEPDEVGTVYMLYGNDIVEDGSNGRRVFPLFKDFSSFFDIFDIMERSTNVFGSNIRVVYDTIAKKNVLDIPSTSVEYLFNVDRSIANTHLYVDFIFHKGEYWKVWFPFSEDDLYIRFEGRRSYSDIWLYIYANSPYYPIIYAPTSFSKLRVIYGIEGIYDTSYTPPAFLGYKPRFIIEDASYDSYYGYLDAGRVDYLNNSSEFPIVVSTYSNPIRVSRIFLRSFPCPYRPSATIVGDLYSGYLEDLYSITTSYNVSWIAFVDAVFPLLYSSIFSHNIYTSSLSYLTYTGNAYSVDILLDFLIFALDIPPVFSYLLSDLYSFITSYSLYLSSNTESSFYYVSILATVLNLLASVSDDVNFTELIKVIYLLISGFIFSTSISSGILSLVKDNVYSFDDISLLISPQALSSFDFFDFRKVDLFSFLKDIPLLNEIYILSYVLPDYLTLNTSHFIRSGAWTSDVFGYISLLSPTIGFNLSSLFTSSDFSFLSYVLKTSLLIDDIFKGLSQRGAFIGDVFSYSSLASYLIGNFLFLKDILSITPDIVAISLITDVKSIFDYIDVIKKALFSVLKDASIYKDFFSVSFPDILSDAFILYYGISSNLGVGNISSISFIDNFIDFYTSILKDFITLGFSIEPYTFTSYSFSDVIKYISFTDTLRKLAYTLFLAAVFTSKKAFISCHSYDEITGICDRVITKSDGIYIFTDEKEEGDLIINLSSLDDYSLKRIDKILSDTSLSEVIVEVDGNEYNIIGNRIISFPKGLWGRNWKIAIMKLKFLESLILRIVRGRRFK